MLESWRNGCSFVKLLYASYSKDIPLSQYAQEQNKNGKWGSTLDMCFVSIAFGVNIVSVSSTTGGLKHFSVCDYFRTLNHTCDYVLNDAPTIWLYHHLYKNPFIPSVVLNHFGCLWPANDLTEPFYMEQAVHQNKRNIDKDNAVNTQPRKKAKNSTTIAGGKSKGSKTLFHHFDVKEPPSSNKRPKRGNGQLPI